MLRKLRARREEAQRKEREAQESLKRARRDKEEQERKLLQEREAVTYQFERVRQTRSDDRIADLIIRNLRQGRT